MTTLALKISTLTSTSRPATIRTANAARRPLARCLELTAILTLLGSSAAYACFTLAHLA